jgi:hypothetical protein
MKLKHSETSNEELQILVAKECGWSKGPLDQPAMKSHLWRQPDGQLNHCCSYPDIPSTMPNFSTSLDAMFIAEKFIWNTPHWERYKALLAQHASGNLDNLIHVAARWKAMVFVETV